jgi:hypothetical protein
LHPHGNSINLRALFQEVPQKALGNKLQLGGRGGSSGEDYQLAVLEVGGLDQAAELRRQVVDTKL